MLLILLAAVPPAAPADATDADADATDAEAGAEAGADAAPGDDDDDNSDEETKNEDPSSISLNDGAKITVTFHIKGGKVVPSVNGEGPSLNDFLTVRNKQAGGNKKNLANIKNSKMRLKRFAKQNVAIKANKRSH